MHRTRFTLAKKRADLRVDRFHDRTPTPFSNAISEVTIEGFRLAETALVHHASRTIVVTDFVHNIGRPSETWTKIYASVMGFYDRVALSGVIRWTGFYDRAAARRSVDTLLEHSCDRLVVGHGTPVTENAHAVLATATAWLPVATRAQLTTTRGRSLVGRPCG